MIYVQLAIKLLQPGVEYDCLEVRTSLLASPKLVFTNLHPHLFSFSSWQSAGLGENLEKERHQYWSIMMKRAIRCADKEGRTIHISLLPSSVSELCKTPSEGRKCCETNRWRQPWQELLTWLLRTKTNVYICTQAHTKFNCVSACASTWHVHWLCICRCWHIAIKPLWHHQIPPTSSKLNSALDFNLF